MTDSSITTLSTLSIDGRSYMVSSSAPTMERRPRAPVLRAMAFGDGVQRFVAELQLYAFQIEQRLILLGQGVLRLFQDLNQRIFAQLAQGRHHRQTADELWDQTEPIKSSGSACSSSSPSVASSLGLAP